MSQWPPSPEWPPHPAQQQPGQPGPQQFPPQQFLQQPHPPGAAGLTTWRPPVGQPVAPLKKRPPIASLVVFVVVLASSLLLTSLTNVGKRDDGNGAMQWAGGDGAVTWMGDGTHYSTVETQLAKGGQPFVDGLPMLVQAAPDFEEALKSTWLIERRGTEPDLTTHLMLVNDAGLSTSGYADLTAWAIYQPSRRDVPAGAAPGKTWQQKGDVRAYANKKVNDLTWTSSGEVLAGSQPDCLRFRVTEKWSDGTEHVSDLERCKGRGVVADHARGLQPMASRPPNVPELNTVSRSKPATTLTPTKIGAQNIGRDVAFGHTSPPAVLNSAVAVANRTTNNVVGLLPSDGRFQVLWERHPGGAIQAIGGFGDVVIAATTQRHLVAYSVLGHRLWSSPTDDVVTEIVRVSDDRVLTMSNSGVMSVLEITTGRVVWQRNLGTGKRTRVSVQGTHVAVGILRSFYVVDVTNGNLVHQRSQANKIEFVVMAPSTVLVGDGNANLVHYSLDGTVLWSRQVLDDYDLGVLISPTAAALGAEPRSAIVSLADGTVKPIAFGADDLIAAPPGDFGGVILFGDAGWAWFDENASKVAGTSQIDVNDSARSVSSTTSSNQRGVVIVVDSEGTYWMWGTP